MRKVINFCFVLLAIAAVVYGLIERDSKNRATKESHALELIKDKSQNDNLISDIEEDVAVPY
ncbi:hypothetical protein [Roseivirga echinicomitans]|uniref:Uncharacterized protein n=1 Tax=Roseivirga echinicomitans TaxID=296218 RepID=A0A150XJY7_9BACT|nr:hypothetical protein [Roseivirga echinicomitans]KYG78982.1 hypothetical protein AWN68_04955 [Roseivirga echinicomitans]